MTSLSPKRPEKTNPTSLHQTQADSVCISESFRRHLIADYGVQSDRTVVIPNPIDLDAFGFSDHPPGAPVTIAFVGRASVRKGVEQLVSLSHRLDDLAGTVRMLIVGGHTLWSDYRPLLRGLNTRVAEVVGSLPPAEVAAVLRAADLLVQPSTYEPFALTVGEALASGTPVVVTDAVGAGDFIDGPAVVKIPASDSAALEQGVRTMLERVQSVPHIRKMAREEAVRAFGASAVVGQVEAVLAALVKHGNVALPGPCHE